MKNYFRYFRTPFIIVGVLLAVMIIVKAVAGFGLTSRGNDVHTDTQRVFDYADILTDVEESKLEKLIAKRQKQIRCDIIIVTIEQSADDNSDYAEYSYWTRYDKFKMDYADAFYEDASYGYNLTAGKGPFGYNKPHGDGVLYLDNWYREADGNCYSWFCTTGKCESHYSNEEIQDVIDVATDGVNSDPYTAYKNMINKVYDDMNGIRIPGVLIFIVALVVALIFMCTKRYSGKTKKTTVASTYLTGGQPTVNAVKDELYDKKVTHRVIQTSSSSGGGGGGGHHTSSGGHSHGGGGGRH